jgi:predicted transcriptional regulator
MTVKEQLHKLVDELPEDDAVEEMQYRLYVLRKVQRGLAAIDEGRGIEHEQIVERMKRWVQG